MSMSCLTSGTWRWFSKRCRTRNCWRSSKRSAGVDAATTRFVQRATIAVLQHERSLVRELNRNPARVVQLQPAGLPGQAEGRRRRQAGRLRNSADGELQLLPVESPREQGSPGRRHGSAIAGTRPGCRTSASAPVTTARPWTVTGQTSRKTGKTPDADWGKHETTGVDGKTGKGEVVVWLRVARRHEVRDPGGFQRHPGVESRDQRLNGNKQRTSLLYCKDFSAGTRQRAGKAVGPVRHSSIARASREEKNAATRTNPTALRRQRLPERRGAGPETGAQRRGL